MESYIVLLKVILGTGVGAQGGNTSIGLFYSSGSEIM